MENEKGDQPFCENAGVPAAPSSHPINASEQLAQLTLDSLPGWMKAPGGIQRFRLLMAAVVAIALATLAGAVLYGFAQVDAEISRPHPIM